MNICCPKMEKHFCNKKCTDDHYVFVHDDYNGSTEIVIYGGVYGDQWIEIKCCPWCGKPISRKEDKK